MTCDRCKAGKSAFHFECIPCCLRWLSKMDSETRAYNSPVIAKAVSEEHLEKVREAWKTNRNLPKV